MSDLKSPDLPQTEGSSVAPKPRRTVWGVIASIVGILVVVAFSIFVFSIRDQAEKLVAFGYPGIFIIAFLSYATVLLPAPGIAVIFTMGGVFHPLWVGLIAGLGGALGEVFGYVAGASSQAVFENHRHYQRISRWMQKNAVFTIFLLSAIPNPFFDLAGIAAGVFHVPAWKFFVCALAGVSLKLVIFAYMGYYSFDWLEGFF